MRTKSTAELVADRLGGDGTCWQASDGRSYDELVVEAHGEYGRYTVMSNAGQYWEVDAYRFPDGSVIGQVTENGWDILSRYQTHDVDGADIIDLDTPI